MDVVNKSRGKLELFNMVDLISLKAGRNGLGRLGHLKKKTFVENLLTLNK